MAINPTITEYLKDSNSVSADVKAALDAIGPWLLRKKRDQLLVESDVKVLPDSPMTDSKRNEWKTYRQALRDLPDGKDTVLKCENATWPTKP